MPDLNTFREWQQPESGTVNSIIRQYESGFAGCVYDPEAVEELASFGASSGEQVCESLGYEDTTAGELVVPFVHVLKQYPNAMPGPGQQRGDCVSHSTKNAALLTMVGDVIAGQPDHASGHVEDFPEVSATAERAGVLATEPCYHHRNHKSDGWFCSAAATVMVKHTGAVIRKDYGFADLTKYNPSYAGKYWKRSQVPEEDVNAFDDNLIHDATDCTEFGAVRDLLARGFGISTCGSEGFENKRDENGVSKRKGQWAHAMAYIGADDRPETHRKYGGPLVLVLNSWAKWNSGPRTIMGTDIEIPHGSFWARWKDCRKRSHTALAGVSGWKRKLLPNLLGGFV